jgi:hypothetical protein
MLSSCGTLPFGYDAQVLAQLFVLLNFCLMVQENWVQDCQKIKEHILFSGFGPLGERVSPAGQFAVPIK